MILALDFNLWRQSVTPPTTSTALGWRYHNPKTSWAETQRPRHKIETPHQQSGSESKVIICSTEMGHKSSGFVRSRLKCTQVMERPNCRRKKDVLMIQTILAHVWILGCTGKGSLMVIDDITERWMKCTKRFSLPVYREMHFHHGARQ